MMEKRGIIKQQSLTFILGWLLLMLSTPSWATDYTVSVTPSPSTDEGNPLVFEVTISNEPDVGDVVQFDYSTSDNTAVAGVDYTAVGPTTFSFANGDPLSKTFSVTTGVDALVERDETVTFTITAPTCTNGGGPCAGTTSGGTLTTNGTIKNDDIPVISIDDATEEEGVNANFTVSSDLTVAADASVTFNYVLNHSNTENADFTGVLSGSGSITNGSATTVTITHKEDLWVESDETYAVNLSALAIPSSTTTPTAGDVSGLGTITNDDIPSLSINGSTDAENASPQFQVSSTLSVAYNAEVTFDYAVTHGTTTSADFTSSSGSGTIVGGNNGDITLGLNNDALVERDETYTVVISNFAVTDGTGTPTNGVVNGAGVITNNDWPVLSIADSTDLESGSPTFTVTSTMTVAPDASITFNYSKTNGAAIGVPTVDADFSGAVSGAGTITNGTTTEILLGLTNDTVVESDERYTVTIDTLAIPGGTGAPTAPNPDATGIIVNDDIPVLSIDDSTDLESGNPTFTVTSTLTVADDAAVTLNYTKSNGGGGGTPTVAADFSGATSGSKTITNGTTTTITLGLDDDALVESDETYTVDISTFAIAGSVGGQPTASDASGLGTITNNDIPALSIDDSTDAESDTPVYTVTSSLVVAPDATVTFNYAKSNGTAVDADFTGATSGSGQITNGTTDTVSLNLNSDNIVEPDETYTVGIDTFAITDGTGTPTVGDDSGAGIITDDDTASLRINDVTGFEDDGAFTFTITSDKTIDAGTSVSIDFATSDVTATAGSDYTSTSGTKTISGGTTATISIPITVDVVVEEAETFVVTLSNLVGAATLADDQGVGTIDNDEHTITIQESSPYGTVTPAGTGEPAIIVADRNSSITFTVSALTCPDGLSHDGKVHHLSDILDNDVSIGTVQGAGLTTYSYTLSNITEDHVLDFLFTSYVDVTVTGGNGQVESPVITGTGSVEVEANEDYTFTMVPDSGYHVNKVLIDDTSVGQPETYTFPSVLDDDHTLEVEFALDSFTLEPFSAHDTIFKTAAQLVVAETVEVVYNGSHSFFVNLDDPTNQVVGILVDNINYPIPTAGASQAYTDFTLSTTGTDYLEVAFTGVTSSHRLEVLDYDTSPISDVPLDTKLRPKPASLMFVLDDSGSMDWEYIVPGNGLYEGNYYLFPSPSGTRAYGDTNLINGGDIDEWQPLFYGINKMFYNPNVTYTPWPTFSGSSPTSQLPEAAGDGLAHANPYRPRYHPWYNNDCTEALNKAHGTTPNNLASCDDNQTFDMDHIVYTFADNSNDVIVDNTSANFTSSGNFAFATSWSDYGSNYLYTQAGAAVDIATWTFTPATTEEYEVFVWYVSNSNRKTVPYTVNCNECGTGVPNDVDQSTNGGQWVSIGKYDFEAAETVTVVMRDEFGLTSSSCADAVKIAPTDNYINILNAHYYTWNDTDGDNVIDFTDTNGDGQIGATEQVNEELWLINLANPVEYYRVVDNTQNINDATDLVRVAAADVPSTVKTFAVPTETAHEDLDNDKNLDVDEDTNNNGTLDAGEDVDGDGRLDEAEDDDGDGNLDIGSFIKERQNWANWYSYYRKRTYAATAAVAQVIDQMSEVEVGFRTINYSGDGYKNGGYGFSQAVLPVSVAGETDMTNKLLDLLYGFKVGSKGTPLRYGLRRVGEYYDDTDYENPSGDNGDGDVDDNAQAISGTIHSPFHAQEDGDECKQVFTIAMTDGYYNGSSPGVGNQDGPLSASETELYRINPYADGVSDTLADVAMKYFKTDLSSLDNNVPDALYTHQHMVTYTVAFGVHGNLDPTTTSLDEDSTPAWPTGTFSDADKIDDLFHAAVNGHGQYMNASRPDELVSSLLSIMEDIGTRVGSGASVSIDGDQLFETINDSIRIFQTEYNSGDWHGNLQAFALNPITLKPITATPVWSAEDKMKTLLSTSGHTARIIATYNGTDGIPFRWDNGLAADDNLTDTQKAQLIPYFSQTLTGEDTLEYLRGDDVNEGVMRVREFPLPDYVHSQARYEDGFLYLGGNGGMLQAFWAIDSEDIDEDNNLDAGVEDLDGDGHFDNVNEDVDGDCSLTTYDEDVDNDGHLDINEDLDGDGHLDKPEDLDGDGKLDTLDEDIDLDGHLDEYDEDLDGDGKLDLIEDLNSNGILDSGEDANGNGSLDLTEDIDGDGKLDTNEDVDGDGNLDVDEDVNSNSVLDPGEDLDGDGNLDVNEDLDFDGNLDVDEDLDGDGNLDVYEDLDGDGDLDVDEDLDDDGNLDVNEDADNDGVLNTVDEDVDGDGNLDVDEDADGDGILDVTEDLDGDGHLDIGEDANCNGIIDSGEDVDNDGYLDETEDLDNDNNFDTQNEDLDGSGTISVGGEELFAYVPGLVYQNLRSLSDPAYDHMFYVDSTPAITTIKTSRNPTVTKTILVGGLGKGGKGYYALDITDAETITSEAKLAERVMWEYPPAPDVLATGSDFIFKSPGSGVNDSIEDTTNNPFTAANGFEADKYIQIVGANYNDGAISGTNDGIYKILSVAADGSSIEIAEGSLINGYGDGEDIIITESISDTDMGYSFSRPVLVQSRNASLGLNGWVVVFGNGYGSEDGTAVLYILDPTDGSVIRKIDTMDGPFNGLSTPAVIDYNNDLRADYAYAGDLVGNMWKFDLTSSDPDDWQVAFCEGGDNTDHCNKVGATPKPLFGGLANQAITSAPDVMFHVDGPGYMVLFGTGKYLGASDLESKDIQSIYGIWDFAHDNDDTGYHGARVDDTSVTPNIAKLSNLNTTAADGSALNTLLRQEFWIEGNLTEDTDGDGVLDEDEDLNGNGILDPGEDKDGDGFLDPGEDTDGDGVLDVYTYYRVVSNYEGNWETEIKNVSFDANNDGTAGDASDQYKVPQGNVGWYLDLPGKLDLDGDGRDNDADTVIDETDERFPGERVINDAIIRAGRVIVTSFGVTGSRCKAGAYSFVNELNASTGGLLTTPAFDLNGDGEVDEGDLVYYQAPVDVDGDGDVDEDDVIKAPPSSKEYDGRLHNPAIVGESKADDDQPEETKIFSKSTGQLETMIEVAPERGVYYWRQVY